MIFLANWKLVLIGILSFALISLFAVFSWQKSSLSESRATIEAQKAEILNRDNLIASQQKNIEAIKKHGNRVQTITKEVEVIKEVIREVPVLSFGGNCEGKEGEPNADAEKIRVAAASIADLFNGVRPKDSSNRGEVLPEAAEAGTDSPAESK